MALSETTDRLDVLRRHIADKMIKRKDCGNIFQHFFINILKVNILDIHYFQHVNKLLTFVTKCSY